MINICAYCFNRRWCGEVGIAHTLRAGTYDFRIPAGGKKFSLLQNVQTDSRAHQPPIQWAQASFPGAKRPGHGVNQSPPSAEVKNEWSYTFTSPICFHGVDRKKFTFFTCFYIRNFHILQTQCICLPYESHSTLLLLPKGH